MNQFDFVSLILFTSCLCCTAHWSQEADVCESVSLCVTHFVHFLYVLHGTLESGG